MVCWSIGARPNSARMPFSASSKSGTVCSMVPSRSMMAAWIAAAPDRILLRLDRGQLGAHGVDHALVVRLAEYGGASHEGVGAGCGRRGDVVGLDAAI